MNRRLRLRPGPLALLALATAVVLLVPQVVLLGKLPDHFDYWLQEYVHLAYLHRALQAGELPLWNGQLVIGTPHLADPQTAVLYPLTTLPLLVLPPEVVARLSLPLHFFIAGACTYGYGRRLGLSHLGALAAGLAYALAPHFAPLEVATYLQQSAAWAPAILWALHAGLDGARLGPFAVAGLLWALQLWRGYAQTWYLTGLLAAAYVLFHLGIRIKERPRGVVTRLCGAVLFAVVGLGAGAAQLLPSFELLGVSHRADGYTLAEASGPGRITLLNLLGAAGPDAEVSGAFPGGVVLGLALAAALYARGQHVWFALGAAALSLALCLGERTPVWALAYHTIPGFNTLHMPHRALFLWSLSLAVLAGSGLDALRRGQAVPRPFLIATGLVVALIWLGLALAPAAPAEATRGALQLAAGLGALLVCQALGHLTPLSWIAPGALTALLAFDLLAYSAPRLYGHFYPPGPVYARPPAAAWLQDRMASHLAAGQGPYRFASAVYRSPETGEGSQLQDNRR
ncbi:MAG TPA: hypothetical protein VHN78_00590, partial [Chloroflexota bacterium]|nr:hypothetical protein [Chloroflexota bacterium]